jgi:CubicO group peptidase (beta-lactamase class C family)
MNRQTAGFLLCAGALLLLPGLVRSEPPNPAVAAAIDELVKKHGLDEGPGVAILVFQPGRFVFKKGYGLANLEKKTKITPRTRFELASVSKTFTATAVLILHDRGDLSVDDDVRKYIPELPEYRKGKPIHIRDLLHHVSGLPDYMALEDVPRRNKGYWVNEDYAGEFARQRKKFPLKFPTGDKYEYNNSNYMLLGLIVERVAKKSFGTFLREEVFGPAGMKDTFVYESPGAVPRQSAPGTVNAVGYGKGKKGDWEAQWGAPPLRNEELLTVGDGGIWTNLEDMAEWDAVVRGRKLLKGATWEEALKPSKTHDGKKNGYGFGWALYFDDEGKMNGYGHDGDWGGFRTSYYRYVKADRTTVLLSNRRDFDADKFWYALDAAVEKALARK